MKYTLRHLAQVAMTRHVMLTALACIASFLIALFIVLRLQLATLDQVMKIVDTSFKAAALIGSTLWAMNRYYALRTDEPQFRIDGDVKKICFPNHEQALLIFRLDLVNTGKTLIGTFRHFVEIDAVQPSAHRPNLHRIYRWPAEGAHAGSPIEPGSWAAINDELVCSKDLRVARVFVGVALDSGPGWTWHKSFDVGGEQS